MNIFRHGCWILLALVLGVPAAEGAESPARGDSCMVVSAHPVATRLGVSILRQGGNAVDAAVAVAFSLSGCEPYSSGLGGGGFFVIYDPGQQRAYSLDARETAPLSASRDMYLVNGRPDPGLSRDGPLAVGVPGMVAGLEELHRRYGRMPWSDLVLAAAESLDEVRVSPMLRQRILASAGRFNPEARKVFLPGGRVPAIGSTLVQADLQKTLRALARDGSRAFYHGPVAEALVAATGSDAATGLTLSDLESYRPRWRRPIHGHYHGLDIYSMAPPSSGGVHLVEMLNILEPIPLDDFGFGSAASIHWLAEAMRFAYADRSRFLGDSDFVQVPVGRLISRVRADSLRALVTPDQAYPDSLIVGAPIMAGESHETTHLSILDSDGLAVSATLTINLTFGSGRMAAGTGVLLNDEMDDFVACPGTPNAFGLVGGEANSIQPGKRPLSSMTPTVVVQAGRVRMVTGSPGGSKIITTTLETIINVLDYKMDSLQAVSAPRVHHQWYPPLLYFERYGISPDTIEILRGMGHHPQPRGPICNAQIIVVDPMEDGIQGASDPRGMGLALGF